jgi:carbonic anhydrase
MQKVIALFTLIGFLSIGSSASEDHNTSHWNYSEHGPACWGGFAQECQKGHLQSPIDIKSKTSKVVKSLFDIRMNEDVHTTADVVDNGHTIQVNVKNGGSIVIGNKTYKLLQFHFHGHSEHTVDKKRYELEGHLVHRSEDGSLVVIGVLFIEGKNNPLLDNVLGGIGRTIRIDPQDILPNDASHYYHYVGSLTTPPCTEGVQWYVLKNPVTASRDQIQTMRSYYDNNFRPVQPVFNRRIESK